MASADLLAEIWLHSSTQATVMTSSMEANGCGWANWGRPVILLHCGQVMRNPETIFNQCHSSASGDDVIPVAHTEIHTESLYGQNYNEAHSSREESSPWILCGCWVSCLGSYCGSALISLLWAKIRVGLNSTSKTGDFQTEDHPWAALQMRLLPSLLCIGYLSPDKEKAGSSHY